MRIAALGDAHLGRTATTASSADGVNQREVDFESSLQRAVDDALATSPELMLWLGDIFDHPRPNYRSFRVAMTALRKIRDHGVGLVAIAGNHDTPRLPGVGNPYAVLADAFPEFHFAYRMEYERVDLPGLRVHCVPQTKTAEDTVEALHTADRERSGDRVNLLLTHPLVQSVERRYADMNEIQIDDAELRSDLVLLGHYHTYQRIAGRSNAWYAGSTDTFSFADEPGRAKGFVLLDTDTGVCEHRSIRGQRQLVAPAPISAWGKSAAEVQDDIARTLGTLPDGAVVRLELDGIDVDVYRMLDLGALRDAASHLLHHRLQPMFRAATSESPDLPELASIGARWRTYVHGQETEHFDAERLIRTGQEYLDTAIESATDSTE